MLRLRKILLHDSIYYFLSLIIIFLSIIRLSIDKDYKKYKEDDKAVGIITSIAKDNGKYKINLKSSENIIVTYYEEKNINLEIGDKVLIEGTFNIPEENTTEYLFNYKEYLKRNNTFYQVTATTIKKISSSPNLFYKIKNLVVKRSNNKYVHAFILGDKSYIDKDVKRSYQSNGISHLFAISGMHIALLSSILEKILKKLKLEEETIYKITCIILLLYLLLVGLAPSVLRGVLFYILFTLNRIYYLNIKPINLFLFIMSLSLLINPNYIFNIGFQYSYLISLSLIKLQDALKSNNYLKSLLKVSITSFLVSIPITLYNFYEINVLSIIYNLFYVPLVSLLIFPLTLLVFIFPKLEIIYNILIFILENSSLILTKIHFSKLIFKRLPLIIYLIYLLLIIFYIFKNKRIYIYILFGLLIIHYFLPYFETNDYIKMIDVGQGDCILLHSNNKNILFDTGGTSVYNNDSDGEIYHNTIGPTLKSLGIKKIDKLILTHGDKDHLGEAETLIKHFKVDEVLLNSNYINYREKRIISLIPKKVNIAKEGYATNVGDFKLIELNEDLTDENDSSQIYLIKYKNIYILMTGDASIKSEENLLNKYTLPNITILKVGHHGSKTSTSETLLKTLKPKVALISSGRNNKFNHPHKITIDNLKKYNVKTYNTKTGGTITINLNNLKINTTIS